METLRKIVSNQYFPAGAVLTAVVLFWAVGLLGGLSLLNNNQPPLTTLTWMLFVYGAAVLTPLAGLLAAGDLYRRWRRNRAAAATATLSVETSDAVTFDSGSLKDERPEVAAVSEPAPQAYPVEQQSLQQKQPVLKKPVQKKPIQKKQGNKKAA